MQTSSDIDNDGTSSTNWIIPKTVPEHQSHTLVAGRITGRLDQGKRNQVEAVPNTTDTGTGGELVARW